jgi:hypothetical protein
MSNFVPSNTKNTTLQRIPYIDLKKKLADKAFKINPNNFNLCLMTLIKQCNLPDHIKADLVCSIPIRFPELKEKYSHGVIASYDDYPFFDLDNYDDMTTQVEFYLLHQAINYCNFHEIEVDYFQINNGFVERIMNYNNLTNLKCLFIKEGIHTCLRTNSGIDSEILKEFKNGIVWEGSKYKDMLTLLDKMCNLDFCAYCKSLVCIKIHKLSNGQCLLILITDPESG